MLSMQTDIEKISCHALPSLYTRERRVRVNAWFQKYGRTSPRCARTLSIYGCRQVAELVLSVVCQVTRRMRPCEGLSHRCHARQTSPPSRKARSFFRLVHSVNARRRGRAVRPRHGVGTRFCCLQRRHDNARARIRASARRSHTRRGRLYVKQFQRQHARRPCAAYAACPSFPLVLPHASKAKVVNEVLGKKKRLVRNARMPPQAEKRLEG